MTPLPCGGVGPYRESVHPVSERIRESRERSGLSQADLARAAMMHPSYVSHLERGVRGPGDGALERLARALGVTTTYLEEGARSPAYLASEASVVRARQLVRAGRAREAVGELATVQLDSLDADQSARVLLARAEALDLAGDLEASAQVLADTTRRLIDGHRPTQAAYAATRLVMALTEAGDLHGAVRAGEAHLATLRTSAAETDELFRLESTVVWAYVARGDVTYARVRGTDLLGRALRHGSARAVWSVHWNLAFVDEALGDADDALDHLRAALAIAGGREAERDVPRLRLDLAHFLLAVTPARPREALAELDAAGTALEVGESQVEVARAATIRSRALLLLGQNRAALVHAARATEMLASGDRRDAAPAHEALGDALLASGERSAAVKAYRQVQDRLDLVPAGRPAAIAWRRLGDRLRAAGDDRASVAEAYRRALDAAGVGPSRL
ncbi:helix-turn-helix transcriptional regulator [Cellulomonas dongxiuzhuiae]|uniref:Helix-turn-helix transcriptional regulator n=1 Tax=Cellulomonas dongxiuzhuiae TaxID=2819979 RepID=A0ABX8GLL1_9CELL|nr:helix-turn-helix transcriptional regulator [Cellulomonas dongxiuzhuiae]MBO3096426.1 helix-turn-helix transcriptional regulator [Cellulomonas dongxiuzhuiae]QWC16833.1 helix-turn-helix transcriptional regulator [Cellulomonas dongxiuzhuiae]